MSDLAVHQQGAYRLIVHRGWCKGCELCVKSCPRDILYLDEEAKVEVSDIGKCIFCGICEFRCPDFAIRLEKLPRNDKEIGARAEGGAVCGESCRDKR